MARGSRGGTVVAVVCAALGVGCIPNGLVECDDGVVCPPSTVCGPAGSCVQPIQVSACAGLAEGAGCDIGLGLGVCASGVCVIAVCGDGRIDGVEVCDDGNNFAGDGCNGTCTSTEVCGNAVIDLGEQCDDGNLVSGDQCQHDCMYPRCGDGVVDAAFGEICDDGNTAQGDGCNATCTSTGLCGNGQQDPGEQCDDGNNAGGDACQPGCTLPRCGDGLLDGGEVCDDGNNVDGDGCTRDCRSTEVCPNGVRDAGEQCDDGNDVGGDGCNPGCLLPRCGDGYLDLAAGEVCDDGNITSGDGCAANCQSDESCGNGIRDLARGEECDCGVDPLALPGGCPMVNDGTGAEPDATCRGDCLLVRCGNGRLDPGEDCDDGNLDNSDGCLNSCRHPSCGDGIVWVGQEICDDGNALDTDACPTTCQFARCGDGYVQAGVEQCEDGNSNDRDTCTNGCRSAFCGDGIVWTGVEACDDGNTNNLDACRNDCTLPVCGNNIVEGSEECDDGNQIDADACPNNCKRPVCGNGIVEGTEACDDGNQIDSDACTRQCQVARCGDGIRQLAEQCDDGNADDTDACPSTCVKAYCGDGFVRAGGIERCDDGNQNPNDHCSNTCLLTLCGNGVIDPGEVCDDGNTDDADACAVCRPAFCGDGFVRAGVEQCDDGNYAFGDACDPSCMLSCGDGIVQAGEGCDDGNRDNDDFCRNDCQLPCLAGLGQDRALRDGNQCYLNYSASQNWVAAENRCVTKGGHLVSIGSAEELDVLHGFGYFGWIGLNDRTIEGSYRWSDNAPTDFTAWGVSQPAANGALDCAYQSGLLWYMHSCTATLSYVCEVEVTGCGNGLIEPGEICDDGNLDDGDACPSTCVPASCGDGFRHQGYEECDDGNGEVNDPCLPSCRRNDCGDGVVQPGEQCDDGNYDDGDACPRCQIASCGDGYVGPGEVCDDGNTLGGDGCNATCTSRELIVHVEEGMGSVAVHDRLSGTGGALGVPRAVCAAAECVFEFDDPENWTYRLVATPAPGAYVSWERCTQVSRRRQCYAPQSSEVGVRFLPRSTGQLALTFDAAAGPVSIYDRGGRVGYSGYVDATPIAVCMTSPCNVDIAYDPTTAGVALVGATTEVGWTGCLDPGRPRAGTRCYLNEFPATVSASVGTSTLTIEQSGAVSGAFAVMKWRRRQDPVEYFRCAAGDATCAGVVPAGEYLIRLVPDPGTTLSWTGCLRTSGSSTAPVCYVDTRGDATVEVVYQ
ncbi:MAG: DUF4215 domain-containing protein [Kofleriaceae bacterium]